MPINDTAIDFHVVLPFCSLGLGASRLFFIEKKHEQRSFVSCYLLSAGPVVDGSVVLWFALFTLSSKIESTYNSVRAAWDEIRKTQDSTKPIAAMVQYVEESQGSPAVGPEYKTSPHPSSEQLAYLGFVRLGATHIFRRGEITYDRENRVWHFRDMRIHPTTMAGLIVSQYKDPNRAVIAERPM